VKKSKREKPVCQVDLGGSLAGPPKSMQGYLLCKHPPGEIPTRQIDTHQLSKGAVAIGTDQCRLHRHRMSVNRGGQEDNP